MKTRPLQLDFQSPERSGGPAGLLILVAGVTALLLIGLQFHAASLEREGLELKLEALESFRNAGTDSGGRQGAEDAAPVVAMLGAPWAELLKELESASHDEAGAVAVIAVEPDREKGRIRIIAEARNLGMALAYVERLQKSHALRYPMLDSHEVRVEDRDQPVRFQLSADWKT